MNKSNGMSKSISNLKRDNSIKIQYKAENNVRLQYLLYFLASVGAFSLIKFTFLKLWNKPMKFIMSSNEEIKAIKNYWVLEKEKRINIVVNCILMPEEFLDGLIEILKQINLEMKRKLKFLIFMYKSNKMECCVNQFNENDAVNFEVIYLNIKDFSDIFRIMKEHKNIYFSFTFVDKYFVKTMTSDELLLVNSSFNNILLVKMERNFQKSLFMSIYYKQINEMQLNTSNSINRVCNFQKCKYDEKDDNELYENSKRIVKNFAGKIIIKDFHVDSIDLPRFFVETISNYLN